MPDRLHQVGLPEPGVSPDEERVVRFGWSLRDPLARCRGQLAVSSDHEAIEGVALVERFGRRRAPYRGGRRGWGREAGLGRLDLGKLEPLVGPLILEAQLQRPTDLPLTQLPQQAAVLILDPFDRKLGRSGDHERVLRQRHRFRGRQPRAVCLLGQDAAGVGSDSGPDLACRQFHPCPALSVKPEKNGDADSRRPIQGCQRAERGLPFTCRGWRYQGVSAALD